jgi:Predicted membrane protein
VLAGKTVVLTSPLPTIGGMSNTKEPSTVKIDKDEPCKIELSLELKDAGYVVLTDINYPGWKAYLDGKEEQIQLANHAMRAVACQPGSHKLVYRYEPGSSTGAMLFVMASLAVLAFAVIARLEKRKRNKMQIQIPLPVDNPGH